MLLQPWMGASRRRREISAAPLAAARTEPADPAFTVAWTLMVLRGSEHQCPGVRHPSLVQEIPQTLSNGFDLDHFSQEGLHIIGTIGSAFLKNIIINHLQKSRTFDLSSDHTVCDSSWTSPHSPAPSRAQISPPQKAFVGPSESPRFAGSVDLSAWRFDQLRVTKVLLQIPVIGKQ